MKIQVSSTEYLHTYRSNSIYIVPYILHKHIERRSKKIVKTINNNNNKWHILIEDFHHSDATYLLTTNIYFL